MPMILKSVKGTGRPSHLQFSCCLYVCVGRTLRPLHLEKSTVSPSVTHIGMSVPVKGCVRPGPWATTSPSHGTSCAWKRRRGNGKLVPTIQFCTTKYGELCAGGRGCTAMSMLFAGHAPHVVKPPNTWNEQRGGSDKIDSADR